MKRRNFIKNLGLASSTPFFLNSIPVRAVSNSTFSTSPINDRILVIVQLFGGNDGINTFIPLNQYTEYKNARPDLAIDETGINKYIELDSSLANFQSIGLHPIMTDLKTMYDNEYINIIQGVAYPDQNRSHFRSTEIWLTGDEGGSVNTKHSGWVGRYLEHAFPNVKGLPTADMQDPPGLQLGDSKPSLLFHSGEDYSNSINITGLDPSGLFETASSFGTNFPDPDELTDHGKDLEYIISTLKSVNGFSEKIADRYEAGTNSSVSYPDTSLGEQFKTVARLISGGSKTKVYYLKNDGHHDTHAFQVSSGSPHLGKHANLLENLSTSIKAFMDDLTNLGLDDRVVGTTLSEFGRKIVQNGNLGTDHGTLNQMFVFGKPVKAGVTGNNIDLTAMDSQGAPDMSNMQYDYRQVYTTLLQDWLGANTDTLTTSELDSFESQKVDIIDSSFKVDESDRFGAITSANDRISILKDNSSIRPNPATDYTNIRVTMNKSAGGEVSIIDLQGNTIYKEDVYFYADIEAITEIDLSNIPSGQYIVKIEADGYIHSKKLLVSKE